MKPSLNNDLTKSFSGLSPEEPLVSKNNTISREPPIGSVAVEILKSISNQKPSEYLLAESKMSDFESCKDFTFSEDDDSNGPKSKSQIRKNKRKKGKSNSPVYEAKRTNKLSGQK